MSWLDGFLDGVKTTQAEGVPVPQQPTLNFTGDVVVTNDPNTKATNIAIAGGSVPAPATYALALQSTGPSTTAWKPQAPTLVPTGGSDTSQIAAAFAASNVIELGPGAFQIAASTTIGTAGQLLRAQQGGVLRPASGQTITLACWHDAKDDQQIFDLSAGGSIVFSAAGPQEATPHHFGAVGNGSTNDKAAIQAAANAFNGNPGHLKLGAYDYAITSTVTIPATVTVKTHGAEQTRFIAKFSGTAVYFAGSPNRFQEYQAMTVVFNSANGCTNVITNGANLLVGYDVSNMSWARFHQLKTDFLGCGGTGVYGNGTGGSPYYNTFYQPECDSTVRNSNTLPFHFTGGCNANTIVGGSSTNAHTIWLESASRNTFIGHTTQSYDKGCPYYTYGIGALDNYVVSGYYEAAADATLTVTDASNTTPIVITTSVPHGLAASVTMPVHGARGPTVTISGATVNTAANGIWEVNVTGASTFELVGSVGNGHGTNGSVTFPAYQAQFINPSEGNYHLVPGSFGTGAVLVPTALDSPGADPTSTYATNRLETAQGTGVRAFTTTGGVTTLTDPGRGVIEVLGTLTSNAIVQVPPYIGQTYVFANLTTGAHTLTVRCIGGDTGFQVAQNAALDGNSAMLATCFVNTAGHLVRTTPDFSDQGGATNEAIYEAAGGYSLRINQVERLGLSSALATLTVDELLLKNTAGSNGAIVFNNGSGNLLVSTNEIDFNNLAGSASGQINLLGTGAMYMKAPELILWGAPTMILAADSILFEAADLTTVGATFVTHAVNDLAWHNGSGDKIRVNATGIGFNGATPVAAQSITGVLSAVVDANAKAVLTSIITALVNLGLATNGTT